MGIGHSLWYRVTPALSQSILMDLKQQVLKIVMLFEFKCPTHFRRVGCTAICLKCAHIILQLATFVTSTKMSTLQIPL